MTWFRYFSHQIDSETLFCMKCGRFLVHLQQRRMWDGNEVQPSCYPDDNIVAISHLTRLAPLSVLDREEVS